MQMIGEAVMKKIIINHCLSIIKKHHNYDETKLREIEYGLTGLYLTFSKLIVIVIISLILKIFKETIIILLLFNLIRLTSFGIHSKKSWICLLSSIIIFIGAPYLALKIKFNIFIKIIIGIINVLLIFINSPADTKKRPIVNKKRRLIYKLISTGIAIIYVFLSILLRNNFISNSLILVLIIQNILISPLTYKVCKEPYKNYINFLKEHPEFAK